jgi:ATP-dependent helicase/nuclease subunit B
MLDLLVTASDGGTAWRHLFADGEARAGFECVGPLGLAKRVGRLYGVRGEPAPRADRVSAYAARLARLDDGARPFSASREEDPWGVAAYLLGLRDRLRAAEWDGRDLDGSARLADLAALERLEAPGLSPIPPGLEDVLAALAAEIERSPSVPEPLAIRVAAPDAALDAVVLRVLTALAACGARVEHAGDEDAPVAPEASDLGRLQRALVATGGGDPGRALGGDGTVLVLEADTALEVAELAAAYARTRRLADATLVAGRELGALEAALERHALPAIGAASRSRWRPALQVLPLRLSLAFAPRDPFRAAELLSLPVGPVPSAARRRLLEALVEQPGIDGPEWRKALDAAAAEAAERARGDHPECPDAAAAEADAALRARVATWFGGPACDPADGLPAPDAIRICEAVARWADARARRPRASGADAGDAPDPLLEGVARVARDLARMIAEQPPGTRLSPIALEQLHDVAAAGGLEGAAAPGRAGRPAVALDPGAVHRAREVIWWGFLGGDPGEAPEPWTDAERAALAVRGLRVPEPGARRGAEARAWRRAVLAASERLVLVRWRLEGVGPALAHPLADEIAARFRRALAPCTVTSEAALAGRAPFAVAASPRAPAPEIAPRPIFRLPPEAISTDRLSPSSLEKLLGCPVAWTLEYAAGLRRRGIARIPTGGRLLGTFAHAILEDLLLGPERLDLASATAADAIGWAARAFDARVAREAAPLVARGAEVERHRAREIVSQAAGALFALLQAGGWRARAAEDALSGRFEGAELSGSADLVLEKEGRTGILDLKLSNPRFFREKLENGEALQVALYAELSRRGAELPPTGYFIVSRGELLTVDGGAFPGAREVSGPSMDDTLHAARDALRFWRDVLARGVVASRHEDVAEASALEAADAAGRPAPSAGPGAIDPPCRFCEYGAVCRVSLREVVR